jgi:hypothetical protein
VFCRGGWGSRRVRDGFSTFILGRSRRRRFTGPDRSVGRIYLCFIFWRLWRCRGGCWVWGSCPVRGSIIGSSGRRSLCADLNRSGWSWPVYRKILRRCLHTRIWRELRWFYHQRLRCRRRRRWSGLLESNFSPVTSLLMRSLCVPSVWVGCFAVPLGSISWCSWCHRRERPVRLFRIFFRLFSFF